jgi:hypothetical protein
VGTAPCYTVTHTTNLKYSKYSIYSSKTYFNALDMKNMSIVSYVCVCVCVLPSIKQNNSNRPSSNLILTYINAHYTTSMALANNQLAITISSTILSVFTLVLHTTSLMLFHHHIMRGTLLDVKSRSTPYPFPLPLPLVLKG